MIALGTSGKEVSRAVSNALGYYLMQLDPGTYVIEPQPTNEQMMRAPSPRTVTIRAGSAAEHLDFAYDTGIR